jgi:hypothetical protein
MAFVGAFRDTGFWFTISVPSPSSVDNSTKQRWLEVCVHAAIEEDPERLKELAREINRIISEEELRLRQFPAHKLRA